MHDLTYLYVEDDRLSREVMQLLMKDILGIEDFYVFEDSYDFAIRLKDCPKRPDVILLDIYVKPINGFEMLQVIRADPYYEGVRVIALTASVMNEEVQQLRQAGFDGTIGKPLDAQHFPELMERIGRGESVWHIT
jgi:two-component system cell cycle response regulator DivK